MSSIRIFSSLILGCLLVASVVPVSRADDGGQGTGNGGDYIALEFAAIGNVILRSLQNDLAQKEKFPEVNAETFQDVLSKTIVQGTDEVLRDLLGNQKTAINFVKDEKAFIHVHRPSYNALVTLTRQQLVFHEYLGVMGLEKSDDYHISSRLDTVLSRPVFGSCSAEKMISGIRHVCTVGLRFDSTTRSVDGAYSCRNYDKDERDDGLLDGSLQVVEPLQASSVQWKSVRIWPKAQSYIAGFAFKDKWLEFEVATPPVVGLRLPFMVKKRSVRLSKPDRTIELKGSCVLQYD